MIHTTTLDSLAARGATVYRVDRPAFLARVGKLLTPIAAHSEHFSSMGGAIKCAADTDAINAPDGCAELCRIAAVPATSLNYWNQ